MRTIGRLQSCDILAGAPLVGPRAEGLGRIDELFLDPETGQLAYALVCRGPIQAVPAVGPEARWVAVPWSWLRFEPAQQRFRLTVDLAALDRAPRLAHDAWPDVSDERWQHRLAARCDAEERRRPLLDRLPMH